MKRHESGVCACVLCVCVCSEREKEWDKSLVCACVRMC
jgi:hypothetical protein